MNVLLNEWSVLLAMELCHGYCFPRCKRKYTQTHTLPVKKNDQLNGYIQLPFLQQQKLRAHHFPYRSFL